MNDLNVLREIGAELDPSTAEAPPRLRGRVVSEMDGGRRRLPVPRFGWRLAVTGGLAAALAAGLIAAQTLGIGDHPPVANAEAAEILQNAALTAGKQPDVVPRSNQFVFVESATAYSVTSVGNGKTTTTIEPKLRRIWLSVDGTGDGLLREPPQPGSTWDEDMPLPGCKDGKMLPVQDGKKGPVPAETCEPTPAYLGNLPTGTDAMYRYLYNNSHGGNPADEQAFITVGDLIRENYLPPRTMAAMFNAAAKIPGSTVVRDVTDAAGRHGVAVAQTRDGVRTELIFDPKTYAYLGEREVLVKTGEVAGGAARLRIAVVDTAGQLP